MNTAQNIDMYRSINPKAFQEATLSPQQLLPDLVNHPRIHLIHAAMMKYT
jgi:hypothetical protein